MRTTTIGFVVATTGVTPGIRRPVRTITEPPTPSRRMRLGEPGLDHGGGGVADHAVVGHATVLEGEVEVGEVERDAEEVRGHHPQRLVEEFLSGLVAVAHDDGGGSHGVQSFTPA